MEFVVSDGELKVVGQHALEVVHSDVSLVAFVEEFEALASLIVAGTLVPPRGHSLSDAVKVHLGALGRVYIVLPQIIIDFLLGHLVEAEIVQDVSEVVQRYVTCALFIVKIECVLQI